jgi:selenocysteine lyase/cysteine desulfurase
MLDHNSVNRPLGGLQRSGSITTTQVPMSKDGYVDPDDYRKAMTARTRLVILNHASNVTGLIQPAAEIGAIAREGEALFLIDAAQTVGLVEIDVEAFSCDLLAFPAHKELLSPAGIGGLYVGERAQVRAWREGGTGTRSEEPVQPEDMPYALEAGTKCMVAAAGLLASLKELDPAANLKHVRQMMARFVDAVRDDKRIKVLGDRSADRRVGAISLLIEDVAPEDVGAILDESFDIAVRTGLHCAPNVHRQLGSFPAGAVRVAPGPFTTIDEIDRAVVALKELAAR